MTVMVGTALGGEVTIIRHADLFIPGPTRHPRRSSRRDWRPHHRPERLEQDGEDEQALAGWAVDPSLTVSKIVEYTADPAVCASNQIRYYTYAELFTRCTVQRYVFTSPSSFKDLVQAAFHRSILHGPPGFT